MPDVILEVEGIKKHFPVRQGSLISPETGWLKAVDGVDFTIAEGETLGLVGESGCGKSTTSKLVLLLEDLTDGTIRFRGKDVAQFTAEDSRAYRRAIQAVFQDPYSSLSPRLRVKDIVGEPVRVNTDMRGARLLDRVRKVLCDVGLSDPSVPFNYPHEFSGGQRQRIAIARALALEPSLIGLDEPVSALDVSIRAQIMNLLKDLQQENGVAYFLIAHDLAVVRHMSNRIGVMYLGKLVEIADSDELSLRPLHPYTQALYSAALPSHPDIHKEEIILTGEVPSPLNPPSGCPFRTRCIHAMPVCAEVTPRLTEAAPGHFVACHLQNSPA
ncbi:oligopeptide/dipeptide ABC transporter ATP-binding protein [Paracoccus sp. (in: a-proteobacteria)]|uniref:ABC transporter ATP-binding protein n=1 Tax=Paracoccus sp. TaxID=267 RepID=UPI003341519F